MAMEMAEQTRARWAQDAVEPPQVVLDKIRSAARKGYAWCILGLDELQSEHLHWLGAQGFAMQKLKPVEGRPDKPGGWRLTWLRLPYAMEHQEA